MTELQEKVQDLELVKVKGECDKYVADFTANTVEKLNTVEECDNAEKELMKVMDEWEADFKGRTYALPKMAQFDGVTKTPAEVFKIIATTLEKQELSMSYTIGMYQLWKYFSGAVPERIEYGVLDSIINTVATLQYKGPKEWANAMFIHNYFMPINELYCKDTMINTAYALMHNAIMQRRDLCQVPAKEESGDSQGE